MVSAGFGFCVQLKGECFKVSGPPIKRGMLLSKATDSVFSGGGWGLATNVVPQRMLLLWFSGSVRGTLVWACL